MFSSVLLFFDIGGPEIMLIMFVALLLFGGDKLPELARGLGKGIRDFKDASEGVKREITNQIENYESKKKDEPEENTDHLLAEHVADNPDGTAEESYVEHTMPVNEGWTPDDHYATESHEADHNVAVKKTRKKKATKTT